jgi:hypothetical protein
MKIGNRTSISSIPRKVVEVEFPEFEVAYRLREMNGTERDRFESHVFTAGPDGKRSVDPMYLRSRLVASCLVDEGNVRLFADDEIEQLADSVPASVITRLFEAAQKLNGLDNAATEAAAKNSEGDPAGALPSVSP